MAATWTSDQILALEPDPASAKAGQGLANTRKWVSLGGNETTCWGECQGSGASPYQTKIDLTEPAFHCSCPSRKFPCKHGLGLFLLLANQPVAFKQGVPPAWVEEWLKGRTSRAEKKAKKLEEVTADPQQAQRALERQAKAAGERQAKVAAGLKECEMWIGDLVRRGLASLSGESYQLWESPAARMVDAQAPGVARAIREMAGISATGEGWQERLLERLGRLALLIEGYQRIDSLPAETQADLRSLIGWTQSQDELLASEGVRDRWTVLGQRIDTEDKLRVQRRWLWGQTTHRPALVFQFAAPGQPLDTSLPPGTELEADLVFFAGSLPLRALVKTRHTPSATIAEMPGFPRIQDAIAASAGAVARNPWIDAYPLALRSIVPFRQGARWVVRDEAAHVLPLSPRFEQGWHLLALSGGHPFTLFGEWDGRHLLPLSAFVERRFQVLSSSLS